MFTVSLRHTTSAAHDARTHCATTTTTARAWSPATASCLCHKVVQHHTAAAPATTSSTTPTANGNAAGCRRHAATGCAAIGAVDGTAARLRALHGARGAMNRVNWAVGQLDASVRRRRALGHKRGRGRWRHHSWACWHEVATGCSACGTIRKAQLGHGSPKQLL